MISKDQLLELAGSGILYGKRTDYRGNPVSVRLTGKCCTWKIDQLAFKQPVKYGLYENFYINEFNCQDWFLNEEEAKDAIQADALPKYRSA
jgi:hypothetical protein